MGCETFKSSPADVPGLRASMRGAGVARIMEERDSKANEGVVDMINTEHHQTRKKCKRRAVPSLPTDVSMWIAHKQAHNARNPRASWGSWCPLQPCRKSLLYSRKNWEGGLDVF